VTEADYIRELLEIKTDFEISTGLLVQYDGRNVYVLQRPGRWTDQGDGTLMVGMVGVGGKLEEGDNSIPDCARREVLEELKVPVELVNAEQTYVFRPNGVIEPISVNFQEANPAYLLMLPKSESGRKPLTVVCVYSGRIAKKPQPGDVSAVVYVSDSQLKTTFTQETATLEQLTQAGATIEARVDLPDNLVIRPFGTVGAHLKYLKR